MCRALALFAVTRQVRAQEAQSLVRRAELLRSQLSETRAPTRPRDTGHPFSRALGKPLPAVTVGCEETAKELRCGQRAVRAALPTAITVYFGCWLFPQATHKTDCQKLVTQTVTLTNFSNTSLHPAGEKQRM